jgi:hypothetical protein
MRTPPPSGLFNNSASTPTFSPSSQFNLNNQKKATDSDLFGLKATLKEKGKQNKYTYGATNTQKPKADTSIFSGLVASQWNS